LLKAGQPASKVMQEFCEWLNHFEPARYRQLSDLTQFDSSWIDYYHELYTSAKRPLYLRRLDHEGRPIFEPAIDTDSAMRAVLGEFSTQYVSTRRAREKAGVAYFQPPQEHNALHDAVSIGVNFFRIGCQLGWKFLE
jgi:hypothetical protein